MGFIAKSESKKNLELHLGSFWPSIDIQDFKQKARVPTFVDDEAAFHFLQRAALVFFNDVGLYALNQREQGYNTLAEVPSEMIGEQTKQEILFEAAIFAYTKKLIVDHYQDIDLTRRAGEDKLKEVDNSASAWSAEYLKNVRMFLNEPTSFVGLT
ncbi:head completion/stabilization protein [Ignatzschineria rhizosphaerae]|uniref:Head completion/stabilization protein n=1 Tax=Ignatzschineria rhizosphaerae TaxID=2923279 RepID=A0ABY3X9S0_9GAMM|nr:head completion/stabilization protein [Ignatzschineria rhizosphaerae]UNM96723.1 head completion/stabilization protein [Ignatzschineria rhizosphaerae]